jgi:phosphomannomutase
MEINQTIFKSYDIRGVYPAEINEDVTRLVSQTYLKFVSEKLKKPISELCLAVGRDIRESSEPINRAVLETFLEFGVSVTDLDLISVNDLYFAVGHYQFDGGVMITASHNPPQYGGLKMVAYNQIYNSVEIISGKDIQFIYERLEFPLLIEKVPGKLDYLDVASDHLNHILSFIDVEKIKPFKIVADTGNGMTGILLPKILEKLSCKFIHLFPELNSQFPNRPPNPLEKGASDKISQKVLEEKADFGVMFDSDGDRMFLVDENGGFIKGDMTLLLLAKSILRDNPQAGIIYNLICSRAVLELVEMWGGRPIRSEVGYVNLARHMREEGGIMGGEVSGHFAFKDNFYCDSGYIALVLALEAISQDGRPLSEIIKDFSLYARGDEINIEVDDISAKLEKIRSHYKDNIRDEIDGITVEFEDWWFNVRPSNTEPLLRIMVEAKTVAELKKRQEEVLEVIKD